MLHWGGMRMRTLRKRKALSQRDLARLAGVSPTTINRIEQGLIEPNPSTKRKIAQALGVSPEDIKF
jgi:transcriptional regulator with XRE-family HTH domain